jgi:hypothetical protein
MGQCPARGVLGADRISPDKTYRDATGDGGGIGAETGAEAAGDGVPPPDRLIELSFREFTPGVAIGGNKDRGNERVMSLPGHGEAGMAHNRLSHFQRVCRGGVLAVGPDDLRVLQGRTVLADGLFLRLAADAAVHAFLLDGQTTDAAFSVKLAVLLFLTARWNLPYTRTKIIDANRMLA